MKNTLNVNIGSMAFVIDEDAYYVLKRYLEDVESRFEPGEQAETMADVEMRIADIFMENLASTRQVVNLSMVRHAISIIGTADEFGERKNRDKRRPAVDLRRLRRSQSDRVIGGVCAGIAEFFGLDVVLVRVLMVILVFFGGLSLWVYILMWIVIPSEDDYGDNGFYTGNKRGKR